MQNNEEMSRKQLEQAAGGAVAADSAPGCPVCGTTMQASGIVIDGKLVSGKWICPKCKYTLKSS